MGKYGLFDIIGPIMIGPSSSHTAGAVRIGLMAGQMTGYDPRDVRLQFHGSLAEVYHTHLTDAGILGGLMGFQVDDERIPKAFEIAEAKGITVECERVTIPGAHPSTVVVIQKGRDGSSSKVRAKTIGGGNIVIEEVNGFSVEMTGDHHEILCLGEETEKASVLLGPGWQCVLREEGDCAQFRSDTVSEEEASRAVASLRGGGREVFYFRPVIEGKGFGLEFFGKIEDLVGKAAEEGISVGKAVIEYEKNNTGQGEEAVRGRMERCLRVMREAGYAGVSQVPKTVAGLVRGSGKALDEARTEGRTLSGSTLVRASALALASAEVNAALGRVVACPTAGSCGILGGTVVAMGEDRKISDSRLVEALFAAAGMGLIIAENSTISGAVGGCQGECGVASAMAAAALVELADGTPDQCGQAVAIALKNILGLVCDPVAGLTEVPCIKRNAGAVANAFIAADMALSGIRSVIPPDEVIGAMKEVGELMDPRLRDTLGAGLSTTPTAKRIEERVYDRKRS
ncbi:MAG: L-serine ammonia-lyase, iron-sulfur-dependent, subunit alpha [Deltaproteobacteria bacterium]|nr:L-serine ammonia-lyase, iron-sulfur-dependent, subunit alpha [Deltaproteobacteria bacterium]